MCIRDRSSASAETRSDVKSGFKRTKKRSSSHENGYKKQAGDDRRRNNLFDFFPNVRIIQKPHRLDAVHLQKPTNEPESKKSPQHLEMNTKDHAPFFNSATKDAKSIKLSPTSINSRRFSKLSPLLGLKVSAIAEENEDFGADVEKIRLFHQRSKENNEDSGRVRLINEQGEYEFFYCRQISFPCISRLVFDMRVQRKLLF
eukprot:TRINITY_DN27257_c0_g1_i2.p1 TRINITY_DN27257_c0_g1~~TRINITY_DN27257_c0_g1_i2.p1  ORF type:complete len:226 (-),score=29.27 TRINITY_DN27257_c0_g1_i2:155-757(-)